MIATTVKKILSSLFVTLNLSTPIFAKIVQDGESMTFINDSTGITSIINADMYLGFKTSCIFVEIYGVTNGIPNPSEDDPDGTLGNKKPKDGTDKEPKDDTDKDKSNDGVSEEDDHEESESEEI
jgi:hypothetical protein